jgi:hypothetical protein
MVAILPQYRDAKEENRDFTIRRLPIYRTDTLRNERELTGIDLGDDGQKQMTLDGVTDDNQDVKIPVPLPVEVDEDEVDETEDGFLVQRVRMPLYDTARLNANIRNFDEYFAALQGVLDVVKWYMEEEQWEYSGGLEQGIYRYTTQEYDGIEEFFAPYVDDILDTVQYLRIEHGDGRLFKIFEDTILALVVKNYMNFDYVVGNPPYVNIQNLPSSQKSMIEQLYESATGQYDLYCPFYERGIGMLSEGGRLGYIAPNQFMVTDYGIGLRRLILRECVIDEIYDFRDSRVFEDATNYPAICILEKDEDRTRQNENSVRCVRVKSDIDEDTNRELDEKIIQAVRDHRGNPGYSDDYIDVFDYPQSELSDEYWALMPPGELSVFNKLEERCTHRMADVTDAVFDGPTTGANTVFVADVLNAEKVDADTTEGTVRIVPSGEDIEYEIEADLLRPWLRGRDVKKWRPEWSGRHLILPYEITPDGDNKKKVHTEEILRDEYPLAFEYFEEHQETLRGREGGRWEDSDTYWELSYPRNLEKFELPKIVFAEFANQSMFMVDEGGEWYFKSAYAALLSSEFRKNTKEIACQLNSSVLEFYFKHIATVKAGGYYAFRSQYVSPLPCIIDGESHEFEKLAKTSDKIGTVLDLSNKTERFPEAYLGEFDGNLGYITYEWNTRRYPVNTDIQEKTDGRFAVTAGRSDEISAPLMDKGDRDERKLRAKYVQAAVDGRNMKKGEEQTIPIPETQRGVEQLMEALEADRQTVEETSIEELESEIDQTVYELFDLTDEEQEVIEDYLEVF